MKKLRISPQSQELVELLGIEAALKLFKRLGGINIEMGKKERSCDFPLVAKIIGEEKAKIFQKEFQALKIYIPKNRRLFSQIKVGQLKHLISIYQKSGLSFYHSLKLACSDFQISENTAFRWLKENP